jgi:hypothetical protein
VDPIQRMPIENLACSINLASTMAHASCSKIKEDDEWWRGNVCYIIAGACSANQQPHTCLDLLAALALELCDAKLP